MAAKFWSESTKVVNKQIAQLFRVQNLNQLERSFLVALDHSFCVTEDVLKAYCDMLCSPSYEFVIPDAPVSMCIDLTSPMLVMSQRYWSTRNRQNIAAAVAF
eukprot:TRINITY_DN8474_c0_g1_i1.p2 TRINITY_DN8474_c0_g1~~TRINITY_DN8474_c0_g1_i1.p2  ORF type:complete len:102 (+),score=2.01 TRINITY_DN8474_c0_g1_i1:171-476(+)